MCLQDGAPSCKLFRANNLAEILLCVSKRCSMGLRPGGVGAKLALSHYSTFPAVGYSRGLRSWCHNLTLKHCLSYGGLPQLPMDSSTTLSPQHYALQCHPPLNPDMPHPGHTPWKSSCGCLLHPQFQDRRSSPLARSRVLEPFNLSIKHSAYILHWIHNIIIINSNN